VARLPVLSGPELIRLLKKSGYQVVRHKGSHVSLRKDKHKAVIPLHDELAKGTLLGILKQCGLTKDDIVEMVRKK